MLKNEILKQIAFGKSFDYIASLLNISVSDILKNLNFKKVKREAEYETLIGGKTTKLTAKKIKDALGDFKGHVEAAIRLEGNDTMAFGEGIRLEIRKDPKYPKLVIVGSLDRLITRKKCYKRESDT